MIQTKPIPAWYAVYTKPNWEKKILNNLREENIECYLPMQKSLKQWSDRKKWIDEPLFRCYIFVRVSYIDFFNVLSSPGIVRYVSFGGKAQSIPDNQIESIKTFIKQQEKEIILTRERVANGIKAEVQHGALKGVRGEIVQICGQSRILIRVETMGCCLYTNISKDEIKLLDSESEPEKKIKLKAKKSIDWKRTKNYA